MKTRIISLICLIAPLLSFGAMAAENDTKCFAQASARYGLPVALLRAVSRVESDGNIAAINVNKNGSADYGHMQVNSYWLPTLAKFGITKTQLMDACTNTHVGAWIMASNISRMGYNWQAIGRYNARSPDKANRYAQKISVALNTSSTPTKKQ
ncbi:MAG: lytic transglycosylase domain-containing protein [Gallionella sp.]